jgi:hypothetical protein
VDEVEGDSSLKIDFPYYAGTQERPCRPPVYSTVSPVILRSTGQAAYTMLKGKFEIIFLFDDIYTSRIRKFKKKNDLILAIILGISLVRITILFANVDEFTLYYVEECTNTGTGT